MPKKLTAKITQTSAIRMSIGHSSSAYSLPEVTPASSVTAASTMISCQPQKWSRPSVSFQSRVLSRRCIE